LSSRRLRRTHVARSRPRREECRIDEVGGFLAIDAKGRVTLFTGKVEMGTGVFTAITQMAAEELSVSMRQVTTIQGDTLLTPNQGPTFGSLSIQIGGMQVRQAAATAREALLDQAAKKLGVAKDQLSVRDGVVTSRSGGKSITYAQLVGGKGFTIKVDANAPLKSPKDFTLIGTSVPRLDIPAKVLGTFTFVQDFRLPGMLHARMVHPASVGANLESFDDAACRQIPGYVRAVRKGNFLAVVASNEWAAVRAATAIAPKWSAWAGLPDLAKLPEHVRNSKTISIDVLQSTGTPGGAPKAGGKSLQATYDFALNTHGSIGPSCAVAEFKNGQLTVWTPTQASHALRRQLGTMLQLELDRVRCIYFEGCGLLWPQWC
jgi:CO/xanthine dehydrogenase Mo-binding subunit